MRCYSIHRLTPSEASAASRVRHVRVGFFTQVDASRKQKARAGRQTHAQNQAEKSWKGCSGLFHSSSYKLTLVYVLFGDFSFRSTA